MLLNSVFFLFSNSLLFLFFCKAVWKGTSFNKEQLFFSLINLF